MGRGGCWKGKDEEETREGLATTGTEPLVLAWSSGIRINTSSWALGGEDALSVMD